jgi:hypothetical protein
MMNVSLIIACGRAILIILRQAAVLILCYRVRLISLPGSFNLNGPGNIPGSGCYKFLCSLRYSSSSSDHAYYRSAE